MKKKRVVIISLLLLLVSVIGISSYFLFKDKINLLDVDPSAVEWNGKKQKDTSGEENTIAIPGFEKVTLYANETKQAV
ncbi:tRNA (uracil-5-)-methyltransferase, partial [Listeria monocytogenes]|nr:tRNA (uracil-5-)-methyltransferase [Listeria monocytogenes]EAC8181375.1 tRNA (uracil-5-)-methyltransferase [Listeria monocytogenes]EAD1236657.1 tRNA (uracil-5-)-methyltransferase [Listeria monocytogenes]EAD7047886.1 tRNA (uracil-5-)-methyltransferase [Listeria monocytogenes]EAE0274790.1 tRNA (uracil-5-)-methyltransferase [Listeria monocytogenes]